MGVGYLGFRWDKNSNWLRVLISQQLHQFDSMLWFMGQNRAHCCLKTFWFVFYCLALNWVCLPGHLSKGFPWTIFLCSVIFCVFPILFWSLYFSLSLVLLPMFIYSGLSPQCHRQCPNSGSAAFEVHILCLLNRPSKEPAFTTFFCRPVLWFVLFINSHTHRLP